jgi:PIN domain nuclease of toxin-antitoxin system
MIVLDTHALLWWALDPDKLSPLATETCERMERVGGFASAISIWELAIKIRSGKLKIGLPLPELVRRLDRGGVVELVPVDTSLWLQTAALNWDHRDPADRVIVATALARGVPVLTKDAALHAFPGVQTLW